MNLDTYLKVQYSYWHNKYEKGKDLPYYAPGELPEIEGFEIHDCIKEDYDGNLMFGHHLTPYSFIIKSKFQPLVNMLHSICRECKAAFFMWSPRVV